MFAYVFLGLLATALAVVLTPVAGALARRVGAVDEPGERRVHASRIPRLGGVAVLAAVCATFVLARLGDVTPPIGWSLGCLLAGMLTVVSVGIADDVRGVAPLGKLAFQTVAALLALAGGYGFDAVTNPFSGGVIELGVFGSVVTVLWIVGITNAFNLIDGLDGLGAGVALIAAGTVFVVSLGEGRPDAAQLAIILAGALLGFLSYNFHPASIFLGDSGSLLLGYLLSILSVEARGKGATAVVILVPILALGLPITDTIVTVLRRLWLDGSSAVVQADREHIHHRLMALGLTQRRAVVLLYGVCLLFGFLAVIAARLTGPGSAVLIGAVVIASYLAIHRLGYTSFPSEGFKGSRVRGFKSESRADKIGRTTHES